MLAAVGVGVGAFSSPEDASSDDPIAGQEVPPAREPARPMQEWELMYFPGAGTFVDVIDHPEVTVALARAGTEVGPAPIGSAVWGLDADDPVLVAQLSRGQPAGHLVGYLPVAQAGVEKAPLQVVGLFRADKGFLDHSRD